MPLPPPSLWSTRTLCLALFLLLLGAYGYRDPGPGWNQDSRMDAVRAVYAGDGFRIDAFHENTGDKSFYDGHWYSDKAPGGILLALPAFGLGKTALSALSIDGESGSGLRALTWFTTVGSAGLDTALGAVAIFLLLCEWVGRRYAFLTTIFLFLGTIIFPYATMLFSHGITAGLLSMGLWSCLHKRKGDGALPQDAITGLLCGWAIITEYPAIFGVAAIFALTAMRGWRSAAAFIVGALPPLLVLLIYLYTCFGTIFVTTYTHTILAPATGWVFDGSAPTPRRVSYLLFSPARGLLIWGSVLILSVEGFFLLHKKNRRLAMTILATAVIGILFAASLNPLDGGWSIGPRHLAWTLPFFAIPVALGYGRFPWMGTGLGLLSLAMAGVATLVDPLAPSQFSVPLHEVYLPRIASGQWGPNLGSSIGMHGAWSIAPFVALLIIILAIGFTCDPSPSTNTTPKTARRKG